MAEQHQKRRPTPPAGGKPSVYGGQWGGGGKPGDGGGKVDRPQPISTPQDPTGTPDPDNSAAIGGK